MGILSILSNASTTLFRALAISSQVLSGPYENVPTFGQLGLDIDNSGIVYGIGVSPQMSVELCQEISLAFSNITSDPTFDDEITTPGNLILSGYTYGSNNLNTFVNYIISVINEVLGITTQQQSNPVKHTSTSSGNYSWSYYSFFCHTTIDCNPFYNLFDKKK